MSFCLIDFETASACNLRKCGAWRYAEDPTTEIICLGYSVDGGPVVVWVPGDPMPAWVTDEKCLVIAHNCTFEKAIWRRQMMDLWHWPNIPNSRWHDSQATCAMKAMPLKLEKVAIAMRLPVQKDMAGQRATVALSKFNRQGYLDRSPATLQRVYDYNKTDVLAELEVNYRLGGLQPCERNVWLLDQRINERGVLIDRDYVSACRAVVDGASLVLGGEFDTLTGGLRPSQRNRVLEWVQGEGVALENLKKETLTALLGAEDEEADDDDPYDTDGEDHTPMLELPPHVRRVLEIRRTLGSSSLSKLARMQESACADRRVRGVVQYHGAGPGRWVGRLFQPQNFPRGTLKMDGEPPPPQMVVDAIMSRDHELVAVLFGDPIETVVSGLRHAIIAAPGRTLVVGDFATIEARIVLALAGQHDKTAIMAAGKDIYVDMAQQIYGRPIDKKRDPAERQTGKNSVLGLGFQMGWQKFQARYAPNEPDEFAKGVVNTYRNDWAPKVPEVWAGLEEAALRCVWDKRPTEAYGVRFAHEDIWLTARLPSGRKLYYAYPQPCRKTMPWSTDEKPDIRAAWTCRAWKMGRWITRDMYGGLLTENVVQALARDLLVSAMFKCEQQNLPICLTVHDEIVAEPLTKDADATKLGQIMADRPQWAVDMQIPIAAETWVGDRYKK